MARNNRNKKAQVSQVEESQVALAQEGEEAVEEALASLEAQEVPGLPQEEEAQEGTLEGLVAFLQEAPQVDPQEAPLGPLEVEVEEGPQEEEEVQALRTRRMALLQELALLDNRLAQVETHLLVTSQVVRPVALCREVFVALYGARRSQVVNTLVGKGVAPNTAKTQYQVLSKKVRDGDPVLIQEIVEAGRPLPQ